MLTIGIVDDEQEYLDRVQSYCKHYAEEKGEDFLISCYHDGMEVAELSIYPDIVFLDISMPIVNGMRAAQEIRKRDAKCVIIFITSMAQYAIEGYEVNALDFIVKPLSYNKFAFKMQRAVETAKKRKSNFITISTHYEKRKVDISDIKYVEVIKHKVIYHLQNVDVEVWDSMGSVAEVLTPFGFSFCNVCYLVNLRHVTMCKGDTVYIDNEELKISRQKKKSFLNDLTQFLS